MVESAKLKRLLIWLVITICFLGVPALLIFTAVSHYCQTVEIERQDDLKIGLQQAINEAAHGAESEKFWCRTLHNQFTQFNNNATTPDETINWLKQQQTILPGLLEFVVWNTGGQIIANTCSNKSYSDAEWFEVFRELSRTNYNRRESYCISSAPVNLAAVRKVIGPQYVGRMIDDNANPKVYKFAWTDSAISRPLVWSFFTRQAGYLLFFNTSITEDETGLHQAIEQLKQKRSQNFGIYKPHTPGEKIWPKALTHNFNGLETQLLSCENEMRNFIEAADYYLASGFLSPKIRVFACINKEFTTSRRIILATAASAIILLLMLPFSIYTWKTIVADQPGSISIRPRIAFVFFFACTIPFLAMAIFAREHYAQQHSTSLKNIYQKSLSLLQNYDVRMQSLTSSFEYQMKNFLEDWVNRMQGRVLDNEINNELKKKCREMIVDSYFMICSHTPLVGSYNGVDYFKETLEEQGIKNTGNDEENGQKAYRNSDAQNSQVANIIGKRIMSELNGKTHTNKDADRMELLFESLLQKSFAEITHSFIKAMGGISPWSFGKAMNLALLNFMSSKSSTTVDYMALIIWSGFSIQREYVLRTISDVNRNPLGLKIVLKNNLMEGHYYPDDFKPAAEVADFMLRITDQPNEEIEILTVDGEKYMAIGFNGKHLTRYQLMGLYPLDLLERKVSRQRNDLIILAIFCILLAAWLAQLLSQSFLSPLGSLQIAAMAIEKREFSFRLHETRTDEFGEVANIFDNVMVSLEELEVARVVQESLFPEAGLQAGKFRIYGRSIAMAELGGDYFDYFIVDDDHLAALMGDVAGHGVGAALIMAMAKAGIIRCSNQLNRPIEVLERLHDLIYSSKTRKQKKIMTFQYLSAELITGRITYANAGGCSPIFFCKAGNEVREISVPGAALGAFKKAKFTAAEIQFAPGDMLVLYTDGIIEARNPDGKELGYEDFARLVQKSCDDNPETVYNNICNGYLQHISGQEAQDDLTMVIICYTG